jgi:UDP-glucose 4-epimerase
VGDIDTGHHTAAVVGAGGFIGSRLRERLVAAGIPTVGATAASPLRTPARTVYFVAGSVTPSSAERYPDRVAAHLASFRALLDFLAGSGIRPTVVLASSGGTVYDENIPPPYAETSAVAPSSAYGRAKLAMERELLARGDDITGVVLRLANVYGPGQRVGTGQGVVAYWLDAVAGGRPLVVYGDPGTTRDYVYVDDVVDAMVRIHRAGPLPDVLNIGSGVPTSLSELLATVEKAVSGHLAGHTVDVRFERHRWFDRRDVWLDTGLAARTLHWHARTGLDDGIARTWRATCAAGTHR